MQVFLVYLQLIHNNFTIKAIKMTPKAFIFYGISGCGKGTQAKMLIEWLKKQDSNRETIYIETGARIREFIADNAGYTRDLVKDVLEKGGLLPEFVPINTWSHFLITRFTGEENIVADGVCRRPHESPIIESALDFYGFKKVRIIVINVSRETAKARLKARGRYDDDDEEINRRFDWYEKNTRPAFEYFRGRPGYEIVEVNGELPPEQVFDEILSKIAK